ncbi:yuri gagarin [Musca autumnalis]|uniref:yuri gagarin n=1 Tax=Musca autumnalis TaxID=221902 RepID=UPI003CEFEE95
MQNNSTINDGKPPKTPPPKPQRSPSLTTSAYATNQQGATASPQSRSGNPRFSLTPRNMGMDERLTSLQHQNVSAEHPQNKQQYAYAASESYTKPELKQCPSYEHSTSSINTTTNIKRDSVEQDSGYSPNTSEYQSGGAIPLYPPSSYIMKSRNSAPSATTTTDLQCLHPTQTRSSLPNANTSYYEQQMHKYSTGSEVLCGNSTQINRVFNDIYRVRLQDIDEKAGGDVDLKLDTYKEWVDMLLKINESAISNMEQLELEVTERLELLQRKLNSNCRHSQGNELLKARKDIDTLVKFIRDYCEYDPMNVRGITLESIPPAVVFGNVDETVASQQRSNTTDPETMQRNMLYASLKALALEVAEKHDEVRELKRQVVCLEDEIQKATKKIQFKDNVIQKLRDDLKCNSKGPVEACPNMSPINPDTPRSDTSTLVSEDNPSRYLDDVSSQFECLSQTEHMVEEKVKTLNDEIDELFQLHKKDEMQRKEKESKHRQRITEILKKSECEKAAAYRKLDFMRRQLIDLESSAMRITTETDNDSGFGSKNEHDQDAKILDTIRKRLRNLNDSNYELNRQLQKLQLENNELSTNLESTKHISQRNSETLRSIADLLNSLTGNFSYSDMYNPDKDQCETNPFCKAIMDITIKQVVAASGRVFACALIKNVFSSEIMLDDRFSKLSDRLLNKFKTMLQETEDRILKELDRKLSDIRTDFNEPNERVSRLEKGSEEMAQMKSEIDDLRMQLLRQENSHVASEIRVNGIPYQHDENLLEVFTNICDSMNLSKPRVKSIHRLQNRNNTKKQNSPDGVILIEELTQILIENEKLFEPQQQRQRMNLSEGEDIDNITPPASLSGTLPTPSRHVIDLKLNLNYDCVECNTATTTATTINEVKMQINNKLEVIDSNDVENIWNKVKDTMCEITKNYLRNCTRRTQQEWMNDEIMELHEERRKYKNVDYERYWEINKEIRTATRAAKNDLLNQKCREIEHLQNIHDDYNLHKKLKESAGVYRKASPALLMDDNNQPIFETLHIKDLWKNYIEQLFTDDQRSRNDQNTINYITGNPITTAEVVTIPSTTDDNMSEMFAHDRWMTTRFDSIGMQNNSTINDGKPPKTPPPKPQRSPSLTSSAYATNQQGATTSLQSRPGNPRFSLTPRNMGMDERLTSPQHQNVSAEHPQNKQQYAYAASESYTKPELKQCPSYEHSPSSINTTANIKRDSVEQDSGYSPNTSEYQSGAIPLSPSAGYPPSSYIMKSRNSAPSATTTTDLQCLHPTQARSSLPNANTSYYEQQMHKYSTGSEVLCGNSTQINGVLNDIYRVRLQDIDEKAGGDVDLKLDTYKEWVDMLLKINESTISNMEQLELEVTERLELLQRKVNSNCRHSQGNELLKARKDIDTLVKFIRDYCEYDPMNVRGITLESIPPAAVFGNVDETVAGQQRGNTTDPETMQRNMLYANLKALALEVAEKHDEVRELKRQVVCLEDEIQKATKKIQFKDNVIQKLRDDLKCNSKGPVEACPNMSPINPDTPRSDTSTLVSEDNPSRYLDDVSSQFECLSQTEHMVEEKVKTLYDEIDELFQLHKKDEMQRKEKEAKHRQRITEILKKSECEKAAAYRKLDFMRRQLIDLESSAMRITTETDNDSGFGSKNEHDHDAKILDTIRKRLRSLNDSNYELNRQLQKLQLENNELSSNLESTKHISQRNSETLRSIADLLNSLTGNFSYSDMYNPDKDQCETNPFCKAIMDIKRSYQERENKLLHTVTIRNKKIEELTQILIENEKLFEPQQQRQRMNLSEGEDIDNITPPASLSGTLPTPSRHHSNNNSYNNSYNNADECPHVVLLDAALQHSHYHDAGGGGGLGGPASLDTHDKYQKIIDDLKCELEKMSCEVSQVKRECCSKTKDTNSDDVVDAVDITESLKELELQNDRLQEALQQQAAAKDAAYTELETQNHSLKCQIEYLKKVLMDRDQHIVHLSAALNHHSAQNPQHFDSCRANTLAHAGGAVSNQTISGICCNNQQRVADLEKRLDNMSKELDKSQRQEYFLHSETRKLNEELNESKRKNADLVNQSQRMAGLLKSQETHRLDLAKKYEDLEHNFEDQAKKLREANAHLTVLNERFQLMERQQHEHNLERKLLHDEVLALKEKEAVVMGRQKSLQEQLLKTEKELYNAHNVMHEQQNIMKSNDLAHAEEIQRLKEEHYDTKRKLKNLTEDYKRLHEAYENEQEICHQSEKLLDSFRKWKENQLKADAENREKFQQLEDQIHLMLQDKLEMLNTQRSMYVDYRTLEAELERLTKASFNVSNPQLGITVSSTKLAERLSAIQQARSRIWEQTRLLEKEFSHDWDQEQQPEENQTHAATSTSTTIGTSTADKQDQDSQKPG